MTRFTSKSDTGKYNKLTTGQVETKKIGQRLGQSILKSLNSRDNFIIGLYGDLGGGKTTFIKGIAFGLGIKKSITSPTFTLLKQYKTPKVELFHFDFYRLKNTDDAFGIGLEEYLKKPGSVSVIEWADRVGDLLPKEKLVIEFDFISQNQRKLTFKPLGKRYKELIKLLFTVT